MENAVIVEDIVKSFKGVRVLDHVNISFEKGKIHGIIGRNGSGKTVLIKIICGLVQPDEGHVRVNGKEIGKDVDFPENIGVIIEYYPSWKPPVSRLRTTPEFLTSEPSKTQDIVVLPLSIKM